MGKLGCFGFPFKDVKCIFNFNLSYCILHSLFYSLFFCSFSLVVPLRSQNVGANIPALCHSISSLMSRSSFFQKVLFIPFKRYNREEMNIFKCTSLYGNIIRNNLKSMHPNGRTVILSLSGFKVDIICSFMEMNSNSLTLYIL